MFAKKFDAQKFRSQCNLALVRVRLQKQKKQNLSQKAKQEIAELVKAGEEGTAQIKAEQLMHDDYVCEALDILETQLSELAIKSLVVANCVGTNAPPDLLEILATVIYAAPRLNIPEFVAVRDQLGIKFGKQFVFDCANDKDHCVQPNVKAKLSIGTGPDQDETVYFYMKSICELYHVPYNREIIGDVPPEEDSSALGLPDVPGSTGGDLPPRLNFGSSAPSPFPSVPSSGGAPSPFPSVPSAGASPFPSVPGSGAARPSASPFPSVPGAGAARPSASPFPSVPGGGAARPSASPFPSVPGAGAPRQTSASAFPSVPGAGAPRQTSASAFPSVPGAGAPRASASAFPSAPGAARPATSASAFPSAPGSGASAFPSAPGAASQSSAFPSTQSTAMPTPLDGSCDEALDGLDLPDDNELPDFDDLTSRMEAIKKRNK